MQDRSLPRPPTGAPVFMVLIGLVTLPFLPAPAPVALSGQSPAPSAAEAVALEELERAAATITAERVYNHLYVLASDGMRGRDTPSPGLEAAAAYLVSQHRSFGLEPAGDEGTWYQRYPFRLMGGDLEGARVRLRGPGGQVALRPGENGFIRGAAEESLEESVVAVEDVSTAPEAEALAGRVVMLPLPGSWGQPLWRASLEQASFAQEAGARAVIHVLDDDFPREAISQLAENLAQPGWRLGDDVPYPQIFLRSGAVREALGGRNPGWDGPVRDLVLEGEMPLEIHEDAAPPNVIAMIRGSDPVLRDEYIVLSAHFDHVGVGQPVDGDSIYNGADDNASGTTALLEVARALSSLPEAPRRSIVFAHVSGEEKGLLGSRWFVDNPTIPLENAVANINADMVGSDTHPDTLVIIGKDYSDLGPLVKEVNAGLPDLSLVTSPDLWPEQRLFYRSDQYHFMRKEIPSLFFFTGLHECYHRPCDTVDFVDPDKLARIARLITHTVVEIANRDARPEWDPEGLAEVREMIAGGR